MSNWQQAVILLNSQSSVIRPPLPPFPICNSCPSEYSYDKTLPWSLSSDRDFMRSNAWGVTIPGLPFVPGGSSIHPERCLTWFLDRWTRDWQIRILQTHAAYNYTHFILSAPDSIQGNNLSLNEFVDLCGFVKRYVPFVHVFLGSKVYQPRDMTSQQWQDYAFPIMNALISSNVVDEFTQAWEYNLFNLAGSEGINGTKALGNYAHQANKSFWMHFSTEVTSWFADGDPRGRYGYWDDLGWDCNGILYQADVNWDVGELQARLVDTLNQFNSQGNVHKLRAFELKAMAQFDGPANEDDGDMAGYLSCCTVANSNVWGYGNGGRLPDGSSL